LKKYFVTVALIALIASCGTGTGSTSSTDSSTTTTTSPAANDITTNPNYAPGLALVAKNDCLTCHQVADKVIGPSYQSVANKYAGVDTAVTYLAHKVIKGGNGVWGTVSMTPHDSLPEADAEQMVKYILLLKTK
jgi:cytochrome c